MGEPRGQLSGIMTEHSVDLAVLTHLHPDHYDPQALHKCLASHGKVICHREIRNKIVADGLPVHAVELEEPFVQSDVTLTAGTRSGRFRRRASILDNRRWRKENHPLRR